MDYCISFPLNSFTDVAEAFEFIYPFLRVPVGYVMANRSFPDGMCYQPNSP